nr:importin beta-like SAD2 homolog [Tanacetum cinerariifolium]
MLRYSKACFGGSSLKYAYNKMNEEISGLRDDLFTLRKTELNLLGVISVSKGPLVAASVTSKRKKYEKNKLKGRSFLGDLLVLPFLSKFPVPSGVNTPIMKKATN